MNNLISVPKSFDFKSSLSKQGRPLIYPRIVCKDGTSLSVQASIAHHSVPQDNKGPYTHVEVGFIKSEKIIGPMPKEWKEYDWEDGTYDYIPIELVIKFIEDHGGFDKLDFSNYEYIDASIIEGFIKKYEDNNNVIRRFISYVKSFIKNRRRNY